MQQYYEELRSYALGYHNSLTLPLGMDLFIKKGMAAWMMAWNNYDLPIDSWYALPRDQFAMPEAIQPEITMLLANMIMCCGGV